MTEIEEEAPILGVIRNFKKYIRFFVQKWKLISVFVMIGAVSGFIYVYNSKIVYPSTLSFVVEGDSGESGLASLASNFGFGGSLNGNDVFMSENMLELLKSRKLVEQALLEPTVSNKKKSYADLYVELYELTIKDKKTKKTIIVKIKPHTKLKDLTLEQNELLDKIHSTLILSDLKVQIKNPENTIIYIDLKSTNEEFSAYFPQLLIKIVSKYYIQSKTRKAKLNYEVIKRQTDSVRRELNNAISGVASANDNTFLLNPAFNIHRVPSAHKEVNVEANTIILGELVKNLELSRMNLLNMTPFIEIIDKPILPLKQEKITKKKGVILGGFLGGLVIVGYLFFIIYWENLKSNEIARKQKIENIEI